MKRKAVQELTEGKRKIIFLAGGAVREGAIEVKRWEPERGGFN